jgi:hypothetical protein
MSNLKFDNYFHYQAYDERPHITVPFTMPSTPVDAMLLPWIRQRR